MEKFKIRLEITKTYSVSGVIEAETEDQAVEKVLKEENALTKGTVVKVLETRKANDVDLKLYNDNETRKWAKD